jgi:hypothetical protein
MAVEGRDATLFTQAVVAGYVIGVVAGPIKKLPSLYQISEAHGKQ